MSGLQPYKLHLKWQNLNALCLKENKHISGWSRWGQLAKSDNPSFLAEALGIPAQLLGQYSFKQIFIEYLSCARYVQHAEGAEVNQRMHC